MREVKLGIVAIFILATVGPWIIGVIDIANGLRGFELAPLDLTPWVYLALLIQFFAWCWLMMARVNGYDIAFVDAEEKRHAPKVVRARKLTQVLETDADLEYRVDEEELTETEVLRDLQADPPRTLEEINELTRMYKDFHRVKMFLLNEGRKIRRKN